MNYDVIEINKEQIPYDFEITLAGELFKIAVNYNDTADLFVLGLEKLNTETGLFEEVCAGEPVLYGVPLWQDVYRAGKYPVLTIVPLDKSGNSNAVTYDNLSRTVFLCIDNGGDENE